MKYLVVLTLACVMLAGCKRDAAGTAATNYETLSPFDGEWVNAVVEIPAGTNHKIEYESDKKAFLNDTLNGQIRIIDFLPYPGNYGFIPGTLMDKAQGGDGDALDIIVLGETQATGTVLAVQPVGAIVMMDKGELDTKIIALPQGGPMQASGFLDFAQRYDAAMRILEDWFAHYKGRGVVEIVRWEDEHFARQEIERWTVRR